MLLLLGVTQQPLVLPAAPGQRGRALDRVRGHRLHPAVGLEHLAPWGSLQSSLWDQGPAGSSGLPQGQTPGPRRGMGRAAEHQLLPTLKIDKPAPQSRGTYSSSPALPCWTLRSICCLLASKGFAGTLLVAGFAGSGQASFVPETLMCPVVALGFHPPFTPNLTPPSPLQAVQGLQ